MIREDVQFYLKIWPKLTNADYQSLFIRSASAVTPSVTPSVN